MARSLFAAELQQIQRQADVLRAEAQAEHRLAEAREEHPQPSERSA